MDLPKEFFTPQSAATLTGAVAITYVVSNTIQAVFNFNPRWLVASGARPEAERGSALHRKLDRKDISSPLRPSAP